MRWKWQRPSNRREADPSSAVADASELSSFAEKTGRHGSQKVSASGRWIGDGRLGDTENLLARLFADAPLGVRPSSRSERGEGREGAGAHL
jgi:hypothetical protein